MGAAAAARTQGLDRRQATAIGTLMNTRGLTELVILNVGLAFGVLDERLFTMLVVMAIVTTVMTEPVLRLVYPERVLARDIAEAEQEALGVVDAFRVLLAVDEPAEADAEADLATAVVGDESPAELVVSRFSTVPKRLEIGSGLVTELSYMTDVLKHLDALASRVEARGIHCVVRSQFSDDVLTDLSRQARAVAADLVLVPWAELAVDGLAEERMLELATASDCSVGARFDPSGTGVHDAPAAPVVVTGVYAADSLVALEVGVRLARSRGTRVEVVPLDGGRAARQLGSWCERLHRAGVACSVAGTRADLEALARGPGTLVAGFGDLGERLTGVEAGRALLVRAPEHDDARGLQRLLDRLVAGGATEHRP